jgi:hypothetical protein
MTITFNDVIISAVISFFLTWLIIIISGFVKSLLQRPTELNYSAKDMSRILQRCYRLFPQDIIRFHEKTFHRGMKVRVTTSQHKIFEGQLIGLNNDNMLCVLTSKYIVAHELEKIEDMNICADMANAE